MRGCVRHVRERARANHVGLCALRRCVPACQRTTNKTYVLYLPGTGILCGGGGGPSGITTTSLGLASHHCARVCVCVS